MNQTTNQPLFTLQIDHMDKKFGKRKHSILKDINLTATSGECIGILGTNGCGKSTLLSILAGIQTADSGQFQVISEDKTNPPLIGYVPQENPLMEELSALDNLKLWYCESPLDLNQELEQGTLHMLGIHEFLHRRVKHMSGGMKKRLNIGCAIAKNPHILLLDEPGAALDLPCKEQIIDYLENYKAQGNLVLIATHEEPEIALCDRLFLLQEGVLQPFTHDGKRTNLIKALKERKES